jgi:hypothetical protein
MDQIESDKVVWRLGKLLLKYVDFLEQMGLTENFHRWAGHPGFGDDDTQRQHDAQNGDR